MGNTAKKTERGTCPVCFRQMDVDNGRVHKHGWKEVGGRIQGSYNNAFHAGECFGTGWAPFETSAEGTWAYLERLHFPATLRTQKQLNHFRGRPAISVDYTYYDYDKPRTYSRSTRETRSVTIEPGASATVTYTSRGSTSDYEYEEELERIIAAVAGQLRWAKEDGAKLYAAAEAWKPGKLSAKQAKQATVHFKREGARLPSCGSKSDYLAHTTEREAVTCSRCTKALAGFEKERQEREARKADGEALAAHLAGKAPQTAKKLKAALGWDSKRFNKALDYALGVDRCYPDKGPQTYGKRGA